MSAHVLLNLLNELRKRDKMRGLPSILSLFRNEFNKFNNTRARSVVKKIKSRARSASGLSSYNLPKTVNYYSTIHQLGLVYFDSNTK